MNHHLTGICKKVFTLLLIALPQTVFGQPFIFQGINQTADSGAGQTNTTDATTATTNPAGLALGTKTGSYGDMSFMSVRYTYAHTNYEPTQINTKAPPVNIGAIYKSPAGLNFGITVSPRSAPGAQPIDVENVPTFTGSGYALYDLKVKQTGMLAAFGAGGRLGSGPLSLGASVLYGQDGQEITAFANEGDHTTPIMDTMYEGSSVQGLIGSRLDFGSSVVAASVRSASVRHYKGDMASTISDNVYTEYKGASYQPAAVTGAVETRSGSIGALVEAKREFWSRGRTVANSGLPFASPETDFKDSTGLAFAARYYSDGSRTYIASCGYYEANTGNGSSNSPSSGALADSGIPTSTGMEFGQMEAIPRTVVGGGIKQKLTTDAAYWMIGGNYQTGTRVIPEGHKGEGWYHLDVYTLSAGLNTTF